MDRQVPITISFSAPFPDRKGHSIMKHIEPNIVQPIVYIHKAKGASQKDFETVIAFLRNALCPK